MQEQEWFRTINDVPGYYRLKKLYPLYTGTGTRSDVQLCAGHKRLKKSKKLFFLVIYLFIQVYIHVHAYKCEFLSS